MQKEYIAIIRSRVIDRLKDSSYPGHDFAHIERVQALCRKIVIMEKAQVSMSILEAAALLHDIGRNRERKNRLIDHAEESAKMAGEILSEIGFPQRDIEFVLLAVRFHRFSRGIIPETLEGKILQDADRIDVCGAIGIARMFASGGAYLKEIYDYNDPFSEHRPLDDKKYILDHCYTKLMKISETLHTRSARLIAQERTAFVETFLNQLRNEIESVK